MMPRWSFVGGSSSLSRNVRSLTCSSSTSRSLRKLISNGLLNSCPKSRLKPQSVNGLMYLPIVECIVYIANVQRNFVTTKKSMHFLHSTRGCSGPRCTNKANVHQHYNPPTEPTEVSGARYSPTDCTDFHRSRRIWHPCHTHAATKLSSHRIHGTHRNDWRRRKICVHL